MSMNVGKEVAGLKRMGVQERRGRYADLFGETTRTGNKAWLIKPSPGGCRRSPREISPSVRGSGRWSWPMMPTFGCHQPLPTCRPIASRQNASFLGSRRMLAIASPSSCDGPSVTTHAPRSKMHFAERTLWMRSRMAPSTSSK
jgi:hypothetical protein